MKEMPPRPSRRRVLQAASLGLGSALSGCIADLAQMTGPEKPELSANAPPLKWISDVESNSLDWTTPRIHDGTIYSGGDFDVWALDAADGSKRWKYEVEPTSDAICYNGKLDVADGIVYGADCREVFAIDENGENVWTVDNDGNLLTAPAISGDTLFFGGHNLGQFDRESGSLNWKRDLQGESRAPPVVSEEHVFVGLYSGVVAAFDKTSGRKQFSLEPESGGLSAPVLDDGTVFVGTTVSKDDGEDTGYLYAADIDEKRWLWNVETGPVLNDLPPDVHDDTVFVVNESGTLSAISATDGRIRWTFETGAERPAVPRGGDDLVYVAGGDTIHAVDVDTGEQRWHATWTDSRVAGEDSPPLVTDGALYVGTNDRMYAFDLS